MANIQPNPSTSSGSPAGAANGTATAAITTICCSGLPVDMHEREFKGLFLFAQGCQQVSISHKPSHAIGFALFSTEEEAMAACQKLNGHIIEEGGRPINCSFAKTQMDGRKRNAVPKRPAIDLSTMYSFNLLNNYLPVAMAGMQKTTLYVTGLPSTITEEALISQLATFIPVQTCKLINKPPKPPLAFLRFHSPDAAQIALQTLHGKTIADSQGQATTLSVAFAKKEYGN